MKVLLLTQFFPPETNAPAHRHGSFSKLLTELGDEVTVICEPPNYPKGVLFPGYKNRLFSKTQENGVTVVRTWVWITPRRGFLDRIMMYGSFFKSATLAGLRVPKPDVIFASSPPLPVLFAGYVIAKLRRVPLVADIRDIWPESAFAVGMLRKNLFFRLMERFERKAYRASARVAVNAEGIGRRLVTEKGVPEDKLALITNGADLDLFTPDADHATVDARYNLAGKFVALYTGLLGLAQAPEIIIEAANILKNERDIVFLIVGEGAKKAGCETLTKKYGLSNVIFTGGRPREEMPAFAARAGLAIIPYKNMPLFKDVIPSKMFDYMGAERPVVININGEGAAIIRAAECGFVIHPEDPKALAETILRVYRDPKEAKELGKNGRLYAEKHYDRRVIAVKLHELLTSVVRK